MSKKKSLNWRLLHKWSAVILSIPFLIIAISGIVVALRSVSNVQVPLGWMGGKSLPEHLPITAYLESRDGTIWIGNLQGLRHIVNGEVIEEKTFNGQEVIGLAHSIKGELPIVATRMAVWSHANDKWTPMQRGRVRQLSALSDGRVLAIVGGRGELANSQPMVTSDGRRWEMYTPALLANGQLPRLENPKMPLHQLLREMHSGAWFLGKGPGEIVWSVLLGLVLVFLIFTGLWMWWRTKRPRGSKIAD